MHACRWMMPRRWIANCGPATWPHSSLRPFKAKAVRHPKPISSRARRSFAENMERSWFQTKCRPVLAAPERCSVSSIGIWSPTSLRSRKRSEEHTSELQSHSDLVCRLLHEKTETTYAPSAVRLQPTRGRRTFDNVTFAYDSVRQVLRGMSFYVAPGQLIGIVGPSNEGDTTI